MTDRPLQRLADFENAEAASLLGFSFPSTGDLVWPYVRMDVLLAAADALLDGDSWPAFRRPDMKERAREAAKAQPLRRAWAVWRHDARRAREPRPIAIFANSMPAIRERGAFYNRHCDYLAHAAPDHTLIVERMNCPDVRRPRSFEPVYYRDAILAKARWAARKRGCAAGDSAAADRFVAFLRERLPCPFKPEDFERLRASLLALAGGLPVLHAEYGALLESLKPRVILLPLAYLGRDCALIRAAKRLGIPVAEFQHGMTPPALSEYRLPEALCADAHYREHCADHLLTFGSYWSGIAHVPAKVRVLGYPHFTERKPERNASRDSRILLLVSQLHHSPHLLQLAADLAARARDGGWRIVFKLHPREYHLAARYRHLADLPNVTLAASGHLQDYLADADALVGSHSTSLYEALALGIRVFAHATDRSNALLDTDLFETFSTADELWSLVSGPRRKAAPDPETLFSGRWRENYAEFLHDACGPSADLWIRPANPTVRT